MAKTLVIGAMGAMGKDLVKQLLTDYFFTEVHIFLRKAVELRHSNLHIHSVDFENPERWSHLLTGDVAFSCLGTTLKQAGSKAAQWRVDYDYQYNFTQKSAEIGVPTFVLVSSMGVNFYSSTFYTKMKVKLDEAIQ